MAAGRFDLAATTSTLIYTCPSNTVGVKYVSFQSRTANATIRLSHTGGSTPAAGDYLEYGRTVPVNGYYERTGIYLTAGEKLYAYSDVADVSCIVAGPEEAV